MEIAMLVFFLVIVFTMVFICKHVLWIWDFKARLKPYQSFVPIVEIVYRAKDYIGYLKYMNHNDFLKDHRFNGLLEGDTKLVQDLAHKNFLIDQVYKELINKLKEDKIFEIEDKEFDWHPYMRMITVKLKVYEFEKEQEFRY